MHFYNPNSSLKEKIRVAGQFKSSVFNTVLNDIYGECKPVFMSTMHSLFSALPQEDIEEIYNDAVLAMYDNVKKGSLTNLTCSIQTYINNIGKHKIIDLCRKRKIETVSYSDSESEWHSKISSIIEEVDKKDEKLDIITRIVEKMGEPCKSILFYFYYLQLSMKLIAEKMSLKDSDSAKTTKNRCMNKLKDTTNLQLRNQGLI